MAIVGKKVAVETTDGKSYQGELIGANEQLNLILDNASRSGENVFKIVLNGDFVREIRLLEKPFDLKLLGGRLEKVFPGLVSVREEIGAIIVMDKIKVTEQGVVEGTGLSADRVRSVYDEFVREIKKK